MQPHLITSCPLSHDAGILFPFLVDFNDPLADSQVVRFFFRF